MAVARLARIGRSARKRAQVLGHAPGRPSRSGTRRLADEGLEDDRLRGRRATVRPLLCSAAQGRPPKHAARSAGSGPCPRTAAGASAVRKAWRPGRKDRFAGRTDPRTARGPCSAGCRPRRRFGSGRPTLGRPWPGRSRSPRRCRGVHQDIVRRLDVAVEDALRVGVGQRLGHLKPQPGDAPVVVRLGRRADSSESWSVDPAGSRARDPPRDRTRPIGLRARRLPRPTSRAEAPGDAPSGDGARPVWR